MRAVWETNVFGVIAVYQAMLPLLRHPRMPASSTFRAESVPSRQREPAHHYRSIFSPVYSASKTALNAVTLAMMIELESTGIKVNLVSPGFTKTNLNGYAGKESLEEGSREVVRVALLGPDGPTNTFTRWENVTYPGNRIEPSLPRKPSAGGQTRGNQDGKHEWDGRKVHPTHHR